MDNVTHTLVGLMLSRAGGFNSNKARGEKARPLMIMLAANAPDMDTYNFFTDNLAYLQVHRGYTHALPFAPLVALVPLLLVKAFTRTRFTLVTLATYAGCLIAVLSHLLLDWTNVYGVRLMLPFNAKWYRLDSTDIIDPVILGVLLLAVAAPALSRLVTSEMGGRKRTGPGRGWAWFALLAVLLYDTGRWMAHDRAVSIVDSYSYRGAPAERVSVFPVRFTVMRWRARGGRRWLHLRSARRPERRFRRRRRPYRISRDLLTRHRRGPHHAHVPGVREASTSFPSGPCCRWTIRCGWS